MAIFRDLDCGILAACSAPAQPHQPRRRRLLRLRLSAAGAPGERGIQSASAGAAACRWLVSSSLNRPEPTARALPPQHTHVTARGRVSAASRRRLPARNARRRGVRVGGTFYFKGRKRRRPKAPGKVTTETRCVMTLPPTSAAY